MNDIIFNNPENMVNKISYNFWNNMYFEYLNPISYYYLSISAIIIIFVWRSLIICKILLIKYVRFNSLSIFIYLLYIIIIMPKNSWISNLLISSMFDLYCFFNSTVAVLSYITFIMTSTIIDIIQSSTEFSIINC